MVPLASIGGLLPHPGSHLSSKLHTKSAPCSGFNFCNGHCPPPPVHFERLKERAGERSRRRRERGGTLSIREGLGVQTEPGVRARTLKREKEKKREKEGGIGTDVPWSVSWKYSLVPSRGPSGRTLIIGLGLAGGVEPVCAMEIHEHKMIFLTDNNISSISIVK